MKGNFAAGNRKALRLPLLSAGARCPEPFEQLTAQAHGSFYGVSHLNISRIIFKVISIYIRLFSITFTIIMHVVLNEL